MPCDDFHCGRTCFKCQVPEKEELSKDSDFLELTHEEKVKALMDFFGLSKDEAEAELEDMGE